MSLVLMHRLAKRELWEALVVGLAGMAVAGFSFAVLPRKVAVV